jgi:Sulfatase
MRIKLLPHTLVLAIARILTAPGTATQSPTPSSGKKPNIVIIWGDDIGQSNISAYSHGLMGYRTPNIDSVAHEGVMFTDYYAEQRCTAGQASSRFYGRRRRCTINLGS